MLAESMAMVPRRRVTDGDGDNMERVFALLRDEMRAGFDGINRRLDSLNGRVNTHAEHIAGMRETAHSTDHLLEQVRELSETLASHRARCPYDLGGDGLSTSPSPRWSNTQLAWGIGSGGAGGFMLMELIRWWLEHVRGGG